MKVQRRAVIDQLQLAMPHQQIRIARGAIDIGDEGVEPHDTRGEIGVRLVTIRDRT